MTLDFDTLYNECKRETFTLGKEVFYDDFVKNMLCFKENGKTVVSANVRTEPAVSLKIIFDETGGLYDYECDCGEANHENGPCKHIIGTALTYEEKHPSIVEKTEHNQRKSDADVLQLVVSYNKKRSKSLTGDELSRAEVVPYISFENGYSLSLTIGRRKQYVIKDIVGFINDFKDSKYKRYGVALEIYHAPASFSDHSNKLIEFIAKCIAERGNEYRPKEPGILMLTGGEFDRLFSLYEGRLLNRSKSEHYALTSKDAVFPVKFTVVKASGGYLVKMNCRSAEFKFGRDFDYAIIGTRIYRVEERFYERVHDFIETLNGGRELFVSDGDIVAFYNSVIKGVESFISVESPDTDLKQFETPALNCKIYLKCVERSLQAEIHADYNGEEFDLLSDSYNANHLRDWDCEYAIRNILTKYFTSYPTLDISDEGEIFDFMKRGVRELCAYAEVFMTESMNKFRLRAVSKLRVGVRLRSDILSLSLGAEEFSSEDMNAILNAYRDKQRYVLLGGGFVDLDDRSLDAISEVLKDAVVDEEGNYNLPSYYASYIGEELSENEIDYVKDDGFEMLVKDLSAENTDVSDLPSSLGKILREYQKVGYNWLSKLSAHGFGGILADDMGLGKTLQVLALLSRQKCKALIICPTTLLLNWQDEAAKFAPRLKCVIVTGSQPDRKAIIDNLDGYDIVITSYDLIRRDSALYSDIKFDYCIADEAQNIKNPETKNAQAVKSLRAKHKFALTGTPVENHLGELWSIFDFVMPGFLGTYQDFRENYEEGIVAGDEDCADRFKKLIMPFILRRLKTDVLKELPPKVESKLTVMLDGEQKSLYTANMHALKHSLDVTDNPNRVEVLSMIMRLREICCHPSLIYPDYNGNSAKLDSCTELISSAVEGGHKVLLFSQFTSMLDIIKNRLAEMNVSFYMLTGDNPKSERLKLVKQFNTDDTNVFLISLKAGGTGLNLTGADIVIHYDPWWNESVMNQATDRAYRLGQNKSVHVYKLILSGTLEESIYELQQKKSALSNMIVGAENNLKDIIKLIKDEKVD